MENKNLNAHIAKRFKETEADAWAASVGGKSWTRCATHGMVPVVSCTDKFLILACHCRRPAGGIKRTFTGTKKPDNHDLFT